MFLPVQFISIQLNEAILALTIQSKLVALRLVLKLFNYKYTRLVRPIFLRCV